MKTTNDKKYLAVTLLLTLVIYSTARAQTVNTRLKKLFDSYYAESLHFDPILQTELGDHRFDDQVANNLTTAYRQEKYSFDRKYLKYLKDVDFQKLNTDDQISYGYLKEMLSTDLQGSTCHLEYIPFTQFISLPVDFGQLGQGNSAQPFTTPEQYLKWLKRAERFIPWMDTAKANMRKGINTGIVLPKALVLKIIPQLEALGNSDTASNVFFDPIRHFPASFTEHQKSTLKAKYAQIIAGKLLPSYREMAAFLKEEYLPKAQDHAGLNAIPEGPDMYRYYIRLYTSTDKSPEEFYQTGLKEVARITGEMEKVKTAFGFSGTLQEFFKFLRMDPQFMPFKTPEEVLQAYRNIYDKVKPHLSTLFDVTPKSQFEIRRVEAFREASANGPSYQSASFKDKRPGFFYVPVVDATRINTTFLGMEATFLHEAIPGHHYQLSLQDENTTLPAFRKFNNFKVFVEGWALYVETLGSQLGCYTSLAQKMGALNNDMQRALRLVVDVCLHTGKMNRQQAIDYLMNHESISEGDAMLSVERYMAFPAQALSYKTGQLEILRLKQLYEKQLGSRFNIIKFHHALITKGDMPLSVLDNYMARWAKEQNR
ncbi:MULTISPECIES: DUF885 domain-containing protein [Niastella]|uniref:DUF885 domain-containing protein n=1 Tax=Niastella soli TaxID=2821487 RepID=A0ABS3Z657_9BACT|nr:DUF885 domain-containing protein [Niastella soli]MBO9205272.1 DUF885 domain-containing protein [Niastella soli]